MVQLVLNDDQVKILGGAGGTVCVVDRSGRDLGRLVPVQLSESETASHLDPEVTLALQRMEDAKRGGTFYTSEEVLRHLQNAEKP